jgi:hypothetical protein
LEDEPEGIDYSTLVHRTDKPSGYEACDNETDEEKQFWRWVSGYGKEYKTLRELKKRYRNWKQFNREVRENNLQSEHSGNPNAPFMDHNPLSDLDDDEKLKFLGHWELPRDKLEASYGDSESDGGRLLQGYPQGYLWTDEPIEYDESVVGPVQNQG